jgi:hypothetical protein
MDEQKSEGENNNFFEAALTLLKKEKFYLASANAQVTHELIHRLYFVTSTLSLI